MRRLFLSLLVLAFTLPAVAQAKHPFTFEDMMKLKRVGDPQVSPDGKWVIFSVVDVDLAANTKTPHVWIVPLNQTAGSSASQPHSQANPAASLGMTREGDKAGLGMTSEREIIADQDADRPRWAPDGNRFAFLSTKEGGSQVWIADFDGAAGTVTAVHKLTSIATEAGGELWSPDGKTILFTSDVYPECDGLPVEEQDCNAKKVKEHEQSKVKALIFERLLYRHWNAYKEGKRSHLLLVAIDACVGTAASAVRPGEAGQHSSAGSDNRRAALDPTAGGGCRYMDLTPGDYDSPEFSLGGQDDYAFSPDGQEICYTSNHDKVEATSTNNDLWIVPLDISYASPADIVAHTKNITADNPASDSSPLYSPDGRYIAYRAQQRPGYESDRFRLVLYDRKTGERKDLTENWDHWVGTFGWVGGHEIDLTAEDEGESPIYYVVPEVCPNGCHPIKILDGFNDEIAAGENTPARTEATHLSERLVFSRMSLGAPTEIYTVGPSTYAVGLERIRAALTGQSKEPMPKEAMARPLQLTHLNDALLSQVAMSPLESFWFPGAHGDKIQGFLVKPPNFDPAKKYPVKFLVHGGPQGAWGDDWSYRWNPELFAANEYIVVMINFHGSTGYGQKFIDSINGDWGGGPFEDLMKGLDYAEQTYPFIDKNRECVLGASFGGYMVNWIIGHTDRFKCAVSHDGGFNNESDWATTDELWFNDWEFRGTPYTNRDLYLKWSPHLFAKNFKTPTLVIHGQLDYRLDVSEGFQLFDTLQMMGVPSKMLYFPDEGHWVLKPQNARLWYKTVNDWVDRWVGK